MTAEAPRSFRLLSFAFLDKQYQGIMDKKQAGLASIVTHAVGLLLPY
jgi:hypothetical protein